MKISRVVGLLVLGTLPVVAQTTGVSKPDESGITANDDGVQNSAQPSQGRRPLTEAKPSPAVPATQTTETYGAYVPYQGAATSAQAGAVPATKVATPLNPDAEIVTSVPEGENELREGTRLHVRIREDLSTATTVPGTPFSAEVMEPIDRNGRVIIPIGAILHGQVTEVHAGHRISGAAALHLEPRNITLPDGTEYIVHAQLIDTSISEFNVDDEGTLKRRDHPKETLAVIGLATGGGVAAGAMLGGGVGALVGGGVGAGVSTFMWLKSDRQATLNKDVRLVFSLTEPMELVPLKATSAGAAAITGGN